MKKFIALIVMSIATTAFLKSQTPNLPSNFFYKKLQNGLEVLVIEDKTVPLATIELVVRNGAYVQTPDLEGLAHLYEHMFFKANKKYPSQEEYMDKVKELGIVFNGTTSEERVNYFFTLHNSKVAEGLDFMNNAARYPLFLAEEMKKENVVVAGEFQRAESNPVFYLFYDLATYLWGKESSRKNTIGKYEVIENATPEIMKKIQDRYYHPNNSMLVIAGDVDRNFVFQETEKLFGDWKPSTFNVFEKYPIPDFQPLPYSTSYVTLNDNARLPYFIRAYHGPDTRNDVKATYAADVFSYILEQKNSKFYKAFIESGLTYGTQIGYQTSKYVGPIQMLIVPNPSKVKEAIDLLDEHIAMFDSPDYFSDEEIAAAKEILAVQDQYQYEKPSSYIHTVTFWWASASLDYMNTYIENLNKVTREDINNFINKYIKNKNFVQGLLVSNQMNSMLGVGEYFKSLSPLESYELKYEDDKAVEAPIQSSVLDEIAQYAKLNPTKKLIVNISSSKKKIGAARESKIGEDLKAKGVNLNMLEFNSVIDKKSSNLNTVSFNLK
jgi:zinc protease